jgi:hypothetical protein
VRLPPALPALLLALAAAGCVERRFLIRTDPDGAVVRVNGVVRGNAPLELPFSEYGVVRLEAEAVDTDGDGFPEFARVSGPYELRAPWYQWFPFDFFSDNLWPGTLEVRREVTLVLPPALDPDSESDTYAMKARIPALRVRAQKMRFEEEARPPAEKP